MANPPLPGPICATRGSHCSTTVRLSERSPLDFVSIYNQLLLRLECTAVAHEFEGASQLASSEIWCVPLIRRRVKLLVTAEIMPSVCLTGTFQVIDQTPHYRVKKWASWRVAQSERGNSSMTNRLFLHVIQLTFPSSYKSPLKLQ